MALSTKIKTMFAASCLALLLACGGGSGSNGPTAGIDGLNAVSTETLANLAQIITSGAASSTAVAACL